MGKGHKHKRNFRLVAYFNEQSGFCAYCHEQMTLELGKPDTATIDHVDPKHLGGGNGIFNEVAACSDCNSEKGCVPIATWLRMNASQEIPRQKANDNHQLILFEPEEQEFA